MTTYLVREVSWSTVSFFGLCEKLHTSGVRTGGWYNTAMTLVEVTYELQAPLRSEQLRALGQFAGLYGLRRFRVDEERNQISFEYDASRLTENEVAQALRKARIAVGLRV